MDPEGIQETSLPCCIEMYVKVRGAKETLHQTLGTCLNTGQVL